MFIRVRQEYPPGELAIVARALPGKSLRLWRPLGTTLALVGASVLVIQNLLLLSGFFVWLGDPDSGFLLASASLFLDVPGLALLGLGILRMAAESEALGRRAGLARISGLLVIAGVGITILWRWVLPAIGGRDFTSVFDAILGSDGGIPPALVGQVFEVRMMLVLWVATAVLIVAAALILRLRGGVVGDALLEMRVDLKSWEGFLVLNAIGTVLVAGELWTILDGVPGGGLLTAGIAIKIAVVPFNGAFAYGFLAYRARRAVRIAEITKNPTTTAE